MRMEPPAAWGLDARLRRVANSFCRIAMIQRSLPTATAAVLLVATGLVHGLWSDRWQNSEALNAAVARVEQVSLVISDWKGQALGPPDVDPEAFAQAGALSYWMRRYVNQRDRTEVTAILMCGRRNRMAVHTPDVCYRAAGYAMLDSPAPFVLKRDSAGAAPAEFRTSMFTGSESGVGAVQLRVFWAWSADGEWQAPAGDARWTFRGAPFLYKLYVAHEVAGPVPPLERDPGVIFLRQLVPELHRTLFPAKGP
jgi:hypothetical protein